MAFSNYPNLNPYMVLTCENQDLLSPNCFKRLKNHEINIFLSKYLLKHETKTFFIQIISKSLTKNKNLKI